MKFSHIAGLYLGRLRGRIGQELLALVGIAAGVSLFFAALVAVTSLTGSFERLTKSIVGDARLQVSARGSDTLDETLLTQVRRLASVDRAAALLEVRGEAVGPGGASSVILTGLTPDFTSLGGTYTHGFSYSFLADVRAVALPTPLAERLGLALGQQVSLNFGGRAETARLGAKLQASDIGALLNTPVVLAPMRYAQELADVPGRVTRLFVVPKPGRTAEARQALVRLARDRANVSAADSDAALFRQASLPTNQSTTMFSLFGALVGFLFAFSAMLLTVPQRRDFIADLASAGYTARTIAKALLFDAVVLGTAASAAGILLGELLTRQIFDDTPSFLAYAFPVGAERVLSPWIVVLSVTAGLVASCVAVLGPTLGTLWKLRGDSFTIRERSRWRARLDASTRRRGPLLVAAGALLLLVGIAIVVVAPAASASVIVGLAALTLAMLALLPVVLGAAVRLFDAATARMVGIVPVLVSFGLRDRSARARVLAVCATGAIAVFSSVALQGAHGDLLRGLHQTSRDVAQLGDVWALAPGEANLLVTTPLAATSLPQVRGVEAVRPYFGAFLDIGDRRVRVFGPAGDGPLPLSSTQLLDGSLDEVEAALREGGAVVVSEGVARDRRLDIGDDYLLPAPRPTRLRVVGISTNMGWPPGALIVGARDFERAWGTTQPTALVASLAAGASPTTVRTQLLDALSARGERLAIYDESERVAAQDDAARGGVARLQQIATLVLVSAVLAMAAAMGGMVRQRRSFVADVKVSGYRTGQLWLVLVVEAAVLIGVGCGAGAAFGLLGQSLLSRALTSVTGFPVIYAPSIVEAFVTATVVTVAAVVIVGLFGAATAAAPAESGDVR